jgi:glucokinase
MVSLAVAGPSDPYKGIVIEAPNIAGWINLPIKNLLERQFNAPVSLGNDANLAALAEWKFGAGRGHHHLIYITVSTGIGGGVIIDDRLLLGHRGLAAELGHVTVVPDGPPCGCGQRGHLETFSAGPGIARWIEEQLLQGVTSPCHPANT